MIQYKYHRVVSLGDVVNVPKEYGGKTRIVAGGTDILVQIHEKDKRWKDLRRLLDITYSDKELHYISEDEEYVHTDPLSTHTDLEQSEIIAGHIPLLGWASAIMGPPQIRNHGALGGSISNGFPASDPLPALIATDTLIRVYGQDEERECLFKDFYEGKGSLKLGPGEFVREFVVRKLPEETGMGFSKLGRGRALAISRLNCAAVLTLDSERTTTEVRIASERIFVQSDRVRKVEQVLIGRKLSEKLFAETRKAVLEVMIERTSVRWSTQYKGPAVREIVLRALHQAAGVEV